MKKNVLFVLFGATILLTMNACKTDELNLDKELKFSKLSVEEQKASIEQNGLDFVTAMEGMQDTKAMTTLMNMLEMTDGEIVYAPMQRLVSDIKNGRQKAFSNFDKQMRISYIDSEIWGEYSYNFTDKEMEQVKTLTNKLVINFPATKTATNNTAKITITYEESTVVIPDTDGELYPSKMTFVMTVDGAEVMTVNFSGKYYSDGAPQEVTQSLKMDTYEWTAEVKNDKKTASESYEFKNGKTTLIKSVAEVNGTLTEAALTDAMEDGAPEDAISGFAVYAQVMDIAIKGGTKDFASMVTELKAIGENLSEKTFLQKQVEILNKYMVCTAFFVDANRKFADVELYVVEYLDEYKNPQYYSIAPRFILSDGSKVAAEEYVLDGFDKIINKIEDVGNDLYTLFPQDTIVAPLLKDIEIEAPVIEFSIGGISAVTSQKVSAVEYVWLDKEVDIKSKLQEELAKNGLKLDNAKTLFVKNSNIELISAITGTLNLGNVKFYINNVLVAQGLGVVSATSTQIVLNYDSPYSIFNSLGVGSVRMKITSDMPKPTIKLDMKLKNTYLSEISLL